jgi:hypothetical protein
MFLRKPGAKLRHLSVLSFPYKFHLHTSAQDCVCRSLMRDEVRCASLPPPLPRVRIYRVTVTPRVAARGRSYWRLWNAD